MGRPVLAAGSRRCVGTIPCARAWGVSHGDGPRIACKKHSKRQSLLVNMSGRGVGGRRKDGPVQSSLLKRRPDQTPPKPLGETE